MKGIRASVIERLGSNVGSIRPEFGIGQRGCSPPETVERSSFSLLWLGHICTSRILKCFPKGRHKGKVSFGFPFDSPFREAPGVDRVSHRTHVTLPDKWGPHEVTGTGPWDLY